MGRNPKRSARGGRGRFKTAGDALDQLQSIEQAQQMRRKKKTKQIIDDVEKSLQRFKHQLDKLSGGSVEDAEDAFK